MAATTGADGTVHIFLVRPTMYLVVAPVLYVILVFCSLMCHPSMSLTKTLLPVEPVSR